MKGEVVKKMAEEAHKCVHLKLLLRDST